MPPHQARRCFGLPGTSCHGAVGSGSYLTTQGQYLRELSASPLPVVLCGHNSDSCDVPAIYQVMVHCGIDVGERLSACGVIGTLDTLRTLGSVGLGGWAGNPERPADFKLKDVVMSFCAYDMGDTAHNAAADAMATRGLLKLRFLRDVVFPTPASRGAGVGSTTPTRIVALRQVIGRIRWLRWLRANERNN